jgi:hypothetical protein
MRTVKRSQATVELQEVKTVDGQVLLSAQLRLAVALPQQDAHLPRRLERAVEDAGQQLKRLLFCQALEHADLELLLDRRHGKDGQGLRRRGTARYTFKTLFGTVTVRRRRVEHPADGSPAIPSAHAWRTPQQVCRTPGLRDALCDAVCQQPVQAAVAALEERAGEEGLVSKAEALKVLHAAGEQLAQAAQRRAERALATDPETTACLLPAVADADPAEDGDGLDLEDPPAATAGEAAAELAPPLGFPGSQAQAAAVAADEPRQADAGWVVVQPDEVKVHAQSSTGQKEVLTYTAVVLLAGCCWHLTACTAQDLVRQTAGLLAALGVAEGQRRLLFLADGARWIRDWFEALAVEGKAMVLCWYHLVKRCEQALSLACRGRQHRAAVQAAVLGHLWHGRVDEALAVLRSRRGEMKNEQALADLIGYVEARRPYLPDYAARRAAGLWIASNRVEKFNDWAVSARCKHQGMDWTAAGVGAVAALEAARRNGELATWRRTRRLPSWRLPRTERQAA